MWPQFKLNTTQLLALIGPWQYPSGLLSLSATKLRVPVESCTFHHKLGMDYLSIISKSRTHFYFEYSKRHVDLARPLLTSGFERKWSWSDDPQQPNWCCPLLPYLTSHNQPSFLVPTLFHFFFFFWWEVRTEKPTQFQSISGASLGPFLGNWYGSTEIATGRAYRFPFLNALGQCHGNTNEVDCHKGSLVIFYHIILDLFSFFFCTVTNLSHANSHISSTCGTNGCHCVH